MRGCAVVLAWTLVVVCVLAALSGLYALALFVGTAAFVVVLGLGQ